MGIGKPADHAQAEPDGEAVFFGWFQRAIEAGRIDADRPDIDAIVARIADDLGRRVKAHRLRIEKRGAEDIRVMAFEPRRGIGDQRKRGRVAFREAIAAEPSSCRKVCSAYSRS